MLGAVHLITIWIEFNLYMCFVDMRDLTVLLRSVLFGGRVEIIS